MQMQITLSYKELSEAIKQYLLTNPKSPLFISQNLDATSLHELPKLQQMNVNTDSTNSTFKYMTSNSHISVLFIDKDVTK